MLLDLVFVQFATILQNLLTNGLKCSIILDVEFTTTKKILKRREYKVFETLKKFLVEELRLNEDDITMEAELAGDLGINSLELADLVLMCEERFNIEIGDDDIHKFITVGDVVEYLSNIAK